MSERKRHRCRPKPTKALIPCLMSLNAILKIHNAYRAGARKTASKKTQESRRNALEKMFRDLAAADYKIDNVKKLGTRHIYFLLSKWLKEDKSASYFANNLSYIRTFCDWIGKPGMCNTLDLSIIPKEKGTRSSKATVDKDWSKGDDFWPLMKAIYMDDKAVFIQLLLMYAFGLRRQEAALLKILIADKTHALDVHWGTKGGFKRSVDITHSYQREILDYAKTFVTPGRKTNSTIPKKYTAKSWEQHYYHILRNHGITKKNGKVSHGLRHGYAHRMIEEYCGYSAPVLSGKKLPKTEGVEIAMLHVSRALGHKRKGITGAYCG